VAVDGALAVVLVCHDSADDLREVLPALLDQSEDGDEIVVVDNDSGDATVTVARELAPSATVVESPTNLGFAGGAHAGARASAAPLLFFLNPDAVPRPGCLAALRACAGARPTWAAWQALVTLTDGERVNSAGNVVHFLGIGWAGGLGGPVRDVDPSAHEVGFASGAALVVRRSAWDAVGGFDPGYFMYGEDLDLGLRLRLCGWGVGIVPGARVAHDYEFLKGSYKWFYLERNRWWTVLGTYPGALLVLVAPALAAFELALLVVAARDGWLAAKVRAAAVTTRELPAIVRRRRGIQAGRTVDAASFAAGLSPRLDSPLMSGVHRVPGLVALQAGFFRAVVAVLRRAHR
jgi:N-acetylglucosaminyl-diphospho-decaprenol L-rhamnosyltransferase